jgi:two-component system NarL family response regulator
MKPVTVVLVDDHQLFREGVKSILARASDRFQVIGEASDGAQAQKLAVQLKPDLILTDIQMPLCGGLEAARAFARQLPETKVVMLTVSDLDDDLFQALKAGARGYILKTSASASEMIASLEHIVAGDVIITPTMATKLVAEFASLSRQHDSAKSLSLPSSKIAHSDAAQQLTEREHQVLELVAQGKPNKEIATILSVAENTVRAHLRNILEKLHVQNRTQAAAKILMQTGRTEK